MSPLDLTTETGMQAYLTSRYGQCLAVEPLSGGFSAFVYRAIFASPLQGGEKSAIVKHVKDHAARAFQVKLEPSRLNVEVAAMNILPGLLTPESTDQSSRTPVRIPSVLAFDQETYTALIADAGPLPTLKAWVSSSVSTTLANAIGTTLGNFLADVHGLNLADPNIIQHFASNDTARKLSATVYYGMLPDTAAKLGLEDKDDILKKAAKTAEKEVLEASEVLTLGDFWTGNVLVGEPGGGEEKAELWALDFELAKPGTAAFDIGQMAAEMYCLAKFRDHERGIALLQGFLKAYAKRRTVDVGKVAIRVGAHFIRMGPVGWAAVAGETGIKELVKQGMELIENGWKNDDGALRKSPIAALYQP